MIVYCISVVSFDELMIVYCISVVSFDELMIVYSFWWTNDCVLY